MKLTDILTKTRTPETQQEVCIPAGHIVSVSVDAPSTSASTGVGLMLDVYRWPYHVESIYHILNHCCSSEDSVAITCSHYNTDKYISCRLQSHHSM